MRKTALAIGTAASICLAGTGAATAAAVTHHAPAAKSHLKLTLTPKKGKVNASYVVHGTGALKGQQYYCILSLSHKGLSFKKAGALIADTASINTVTATKSGKVKCNQFLVKFHGSGKYKKHSCPPSRADKKSGWGCGVALADVKSRGSKSLAIALFKF